MIINKIFRRSSPFGAAVKTFILGTMSLMLLFLLVHQVDAKEAKIKVVASIFPVFDFAREIGGEYIQLWQLLPPGVEAHGFSPTPRDIIRVNQADLFLYAGAIMEPRVDKLLRSLDGDVGIIDLSVGILPAASTHHDHHGVDPHFWLDPLNAKLMVEMITQSFIHIDSVHAKEYRSRADAYLLKLTNLDTKIRTGLADCDRHTIISGGHFAFGHFVKRYNLHAVSAYPGFSPDGRPSPKGITTLLKTMETTGATAVYHEELMDPKVARIIVEETGAQLFLLHGAHNVSKQEMADSVSYISIMQDNVKRLRLGLSCR